MRYDELADWLLAEIGRLVGRDPATIRQDDKFSSYGLDSLRATHLVKALADLLGRPVPVTLLFARPTVRSLTTGLLEGVLDGALVTGIAAPAAAPTTINDPIAVVGLSCRLPAGDGPAQFWRALLDGSDAVRQVPPDRWNPESPVGGGPADPATAVTAQAGFLPGRIDGFDPLFFGISPREAQEMDPQQRLFLEVAWESMEDAGLADGRLDGSRTGVFVGAIWHDFADLAQRAASRLTSHSATGRALNMVANRLSYALGLRGPSVVVDSACSSSLLAVHLACQSIWAGESTTAIAGGVNLLLDPTSMVALTRFGGLAPDGRCKAFSADADGFGRGEGAVALVLRPLRLALADGDDIYCTIRGSATNNDGRSNGLTAPNPVAQEEVLREAYRRAGVDPGEVHYVETHGTGTMLGDPIEAGALSAVLCADRPPQQNLVIGSVKTNIGHLEGAAGVAGLLKAVLVLRHRAIPPNLHFDRPNPHIAFDDLRLRVPTEVEPWPAQQPPLAGVSAFGWGGTNVHLVLEGWTEPARMTVPPVERTRPEGTRPRVAFVCSPYGQQWTGMGRDLYRTEPVFRAVVRRCDHEFHRLTGISLVEEMFRDRGREDAEDVGVMQPLLFAVQVGLAAWLEDRGIRPDAVVGHSLGEVAAAVIAGILDLTAAVHLIHHYSDQQRRVAGTGGGMALVELSAAEVTALLTERGLAAVVAAENGPRSTALTGDRETLRTLVAQWKADGVLCSLIRVDLAAHGPAIDLVSDDLRTALAGLTPRPGRLPMISTVTGRPLDWRQAGADYFVRNLRQPVLLADAVRFLLDDGHDLFLEISAAPVLLPALRQSVENVDRPAQVLPTLRRDDDHGLAETLAECRALGLDVRPPAHHEDTAELVTLSAQHPQALRDLARQVAAGIGTPAEHPPSMADLAAAALRRSGQSHRLAVVAHQVPELAEHLGRFAAGERVVGLAVSDRAVDAPPRTVFVFPGQGSQWVGMGQGLLGRAEAFDAAIRACDAACRPHLGRSVRDLLRQPPDAASFGPIDVVQPLLFSVQVALAAQWRAWGVTPDAVVGHSMGEVAAAHVAGILSLDDAAQIICRRSRLMRRLSGQGAMLAVELTVDEAREAISGHEAVVSIGVNNSPRSTVLSGDVAALTGIAETLERAAVFCRWVNVDVASHSPQMDVLRDDLLAALDGLTHHAARLPLYSTVTGTVVHGTDLLPDYWVDNLREPVLFGDQIARLLADGAGVFVEASPHPILLPAVEQVAAASDGTVTVLASMRRHEPERDTLLSTLGALHVAGVSVALDRALTPGDARVTLPPYPWQRERYWPEGMAGFDGGDTPPPVAAPTGAATAVLADRLDSPIVPGHHYWQMRYDADTAAIGDHRIGGQVVVPGALYVDVALRAAAETLPCAPSVLSDLVFSQALAIPDRGSRRVQVTLDATTRPAQLQVFGVSDDGPTPVMRVLLTAATGDPPPPVDPAAVAARTPTLVEGAAFYADLATRGLRFGPAYQGILEIRHNDVEALARIGSPTTAALPDTRVHPAVLDAALQSALAPLLATATPDTAYLSTGAERVVVHRAPGTSAWAHAVHRPVSDERYPVADVRLFGSDGELLVDLRGLGLVRTRGLPVEASPDDTTPTQLATGPTLAEVTDPQQRRALLAAAVLTHVAEVVRLPEHRLDEGTPLRSMGVDSVMALELRHRLERLTGLRLSATLIYNHPTIDQITRHLADRLGQPEDARQPAAARRPEPAPTATPTPADESLDSLEAELAAELAELNRRMEMI
ncbi:type I polyketide synthase [Verrucosispora sp. NA02020]|uniref:type I polyketide synthase n=1 Tax=Verrucosispora sp. NA02020 TaxID=2742132 RepID=UPI001592AD87|nr:type I polyketide synthase [Verrucosispora sp. NA02020]QKW13876.1 acyltransferase domain-containing protein [Verrucosispora sp. NA02020]